MKIIFLDIDGVLNNINTRKKSFNAPVPDAYKGFDKRILWEDLVYFDKDLVGNLAKIVAETGAKIVISSSWRYMRTKDQMQELLDLSGGQGVFDVIDMTDKRLARFSAIDKWLEDHPEVTHYVVLDDDHQSHEWGNLDYKKLRQVRTVDETGLDEACTERALYVLSQEV